MRPQCISSGHSLSVVFLVLYLLLGKTVSSKIPVAELHNSTRVTGGYVELQKSNCKEISSIFCRTVVVWMCGSGWWKERLTGVFLGICVKCFQEFLTGISLDSGINFYFLGKIEASGPKKKAQTNSFWLHSAEILYPGCEFLFPQASMMFAQCTQKCASSVLLIALLCCILSPPAQASKVSERLQTQALNRVCSTTETEMAEKQLFFCGSLQR